LKVHSLDDTINAALIVTSSEVHCGDGIARPSAAKNI